MVPAFVRDSQKLFCDVTAAKPGNPLTAAISHPHNCRNWATAEVELGSTFAMRQAIWRTILTFSTAKLYEGSRVAYKSVQVVPNLANTIVTYPPALNFEPNPQDVIASPTSSVNGISRVRIARIRRRSRRIAKKASVHPALLLSVTFLSFFKFFVCLLWIEYVFFCAVRLLVLFTCTCTLLSLLCAPRSHMHLGLLAEHAVGDTSCSGKITTVKTWY